MRKALMFAISAICMMFFLPLETKMQIVTYIGMPLVMIGGSVLFVREKIAGIITGAVISAMLIALIG